MFIFTRRASAVTHTVVSPAADSLIGFNGRRQNARINIINCGGHTIEVFELFVLTLFGATVCVYIQWCIQRWVKGL